MASADQKRADEKKNRGEALVESSLLRKSGPMPGLMTANAEHGYLEALLRGFKSGFIKESEYRQLAQCETLDDVKLTLGDTDYASVLQNQNKLSSEIIYSKIVGKTIDEFNFLRAEALGHLSTFLDFMTYDYLIQNICFVIAGLIKGSDPEQLLARIHPLGRSPHLKSILTFENQTSADGLVELYRTVLVETPVARYFSAYFSAETKGDQPSREIQRVYNEIEIDVITNMLQKLWLEDFYKYCLDLGGETGETMKELLEFEADRRAINIIINSFGTSLNEQQARDGDRRALFCNFGKFYPQGVLKTFSQVGDMAALQNALTPYPAYARLLKKATETGRDVSEILAEKEVELCLLAFNGQSQFACFYSFIKLKEREHANVRYLLACIAQKRDPKDRSKYIKLEIPPPSARV